jgi:hypothetical protein
VDSKQKEKKRHFGNGSEGEFEVGKRLDLPKTET